MAAASAGSCDDFPFLVATGTTTPEPNPGEARQVSADAVESILSARPTETGGPQAARSPRASARSS
jgi:hypothetical protein